MDAPIVVSLHPGGQLANNTLDVLLSHSLVSLKIWSGVPKHGGKVTRFILFSARFFSGNCVKRGFFLTYVNLFDLR